MKLVRFQGRLELISSDRILLLSLRYDYYLRKCPGAIRVSKFSQRFGRYYEC